LRGVAGCAELDRAGSHAGVTHSEPEAPPNVRDCAGFSDTCITEQAHTWTGVREAPRHEVAGDGASMVRRTNYGEPTHWKGAPMPLDQERDTV
jgi:hypothetical protein